ncbi:hypothetical protein [Actinomadura napierensis]|uniref:Uncharacterized protein n=1 Tax=Actinomadura napierensis TaxID=267854 RepID=A0ABN2XU43_9ACTN
MTSLARGVLHHCGDHLELGRRGAASIARRHSLSSVAHTIDELRHRLHAIDPDVLVGGGPAVQLDYRRAALSYTERIVPLMLLATVVLSFAVSLDLSRSRLHPHAGLRQRQGSTAQEHAGPLGADGWL